MPSAARNVNHQAAFAPDDCQGRGSLPCGFSQRRNERNVSALTDAARRAQRQSSGGFAPDDCPGRGSHSASHAENVQ
jgi:hypothetical protein